MFRQYLFLSVGATALLVMLGAPGQLQAQRMRGSSSVMVQPSFRGGFMPGFNRGFSNPGFNRGSMPGFNRGSPELRLFPTMPRGSASLFNPMMSGSGAPLFTPTRPSIFVP
jgi:hypothetical protein